MFNSRIQIGDVKPIGPVWPHRSIDKIKNNKNEQEQDKERKNNQSKDDDSTNDGNSIDEFV